MPTRSSPIAAIWAALLIGVSLWEIAATRCDATSVPDDDAWDRAAATVRAAVQPDDLIVFAPGWVDPVGRLHLGDLISIDAAARMDAARYPRIWELSIRGARAAETAGLEPVTDVDVDGVRVRRYDQAAAIVTADIRDQLSAAKVDGAPLHPPSLEIAEVGFAPHRCIEVVPQPGKPVRIAFSQLTLGRELVGYMGLADVFTRREIRSPGSLAVEIGGVQVATAVAGVDDGWVRFAAPTTPGPADVTFVLTATERDRLICFAAEARQ
ncbi:MAG TPA: hypothetical protein VGO00_22835 [Kofleriaceae bacterium]|nr:hypothetical protein [Kofleriaceae bacterium]